MFLAREHYLQAPILRGVHLVIEVRVVWGDTGAGHAVLQELGVAAVGIAAPFRPALVVVISYRGEVWKVLAKDAVDRSEEAVRVLLIVEVSLVQDEIGAFGLYEPEDSAKVLSVARITDERDLQRGFRGDGRRERW